LDRTRRPHPVIATPADDIKLIRHCERSEAIQDVLVRLWIASLRSQ